jgi:hypothetical protein
VSRVKRISTATFFAVFIVFATNVNAVAQAPNGPGRGQEIPRFSVKKAAMRDVVAALSSMPNLTAHVGFEEITRERIMDSVDRSVTLSVTLEHTTVQQIVSTLCSSDPRYSWAEDGDWINIFPRDKERDPKYLFNLRVKSVILQNIPNPDEAVAQLHLQDLVGGEQIGYMEVGGDNSYVAPWTVELQDISVRQYINRIAEHSGPRASWVWQGGRDERMFSFYKLGFRTDSSAQAQ